MPGKHKPKPNSSGPILSAEQLRAGGLGSEPKKPELLQQLEFGERKRLEEAAARTKELIEAAKEITRELDTVADVRAEIRDVYAMIKLDVITSNKGARLVYALQAMLPFIEREQVEKRDFARSVKSLDLYSKGLGATSPLNKILESRRKPAAEKGEKNEEQSGELGRTSGACRENSEAGEGHTEEQGTILHC